MDAAFWCVNTGLESLNDYFIIFPMGTDKRVALREMEYIECA